MSYQALYRKFRPDTFEEVKGQDAIITTLRNQVQTGRIGHAYLFCGTRGTGKTTVAKILAQAVNCEAPVNGEACHSCESCRAIEDGSAINVIEIDAASNNGVDNIREIREEVAYPPTQGKYKVYIIDEVHMLSAGAFNALLKTLEEPPSYVIFILATTEARKIPATILSRCQRYDFRRITADVIVARLSELMEREGLSVEKEALAYISRQADGSMRDALSILDQCLSFYPGETLTYRHVLDILGAVDPSVFSELLGFITKGDVAGALSILSSLLDQGRDLTQFIGDMIWHLRNLLLIKSTSKGAGEEDVLNISADNIEGLRKEADAIEFSALFRLIRIFSELSADVRMSEQKRLLVEVALIRMCRPEMETDNDSLAERIRVLEERGGTSSGGADPAQMQALMRQIEEREKAMRAETKRAVEEALKRAGAPAKEALPKPELPAAVPEDVKAVIARFREIVSGMDSMWQSYLRDVRLSLSKAGNLLLVFPTEVARGYFERQQKPLEDYLGDKTGKKIHIEIQSVPEQHSFEDIYVDLEKKIRMPIETEDAD